MSASDDRLEKIPSLLKAARTTKTSLWNDSADPVELARSIEFGAVGATCNPVIALAAIKGNLSTRLPRLKEIADSHPSASESEIGWLFDHGGAAV